MWPSFIGISGPLHTWLAKPRGDCCPNSSYFWARGEGVHKLYYVRPLTTHSVKAERQSPSAKTHTFVCFSMECVYFAFDEHFVFSCVTFCYVVYWCS